MVSAGAAHYRAYGIDRAPNPISDVTLADVTMVLGANVPETFPIFIRHYWEALWSPNGSPGSPLTPW